MRKKFLFDRISKDTRVFTTKLYHCLGYVSASYQPNGRCQKISNFRDPASDILDAPEKIRDSRTVGYIAISDFQISKKKFHRTLKH